MIERNMPVLEMQCTKMLTLVFRIGLKVYGLLCESHPKQCTYSKVMIKTLVKFFLIFSTYAKMFKQSLPKAS